MALGLIHNCSLNGHTKKSILSDAEKIYEMEVRGFIKNQE